MQGFSTATPNVLSYLNSITQPKFATKIENGSYVFKDGTTGVKTNFTKYTPTFENKTQEIVKKTTPALNFDAVVSQVGVTNIEDYKNTLPKQEKIPQEKPGIFDKISNTIVPKVGAYDLNDEDVKMLDDAVGQGYSQDEALDLLNEFKQTQGVDIYGETPKEEQNLPGLDIGVKASQGISEFGKNFKFEAGNDLINSKNPFVSSFGNMLESFKFAGNIPGDTIQLVGDLGQAISNPIGTAKSIKTLAEATIETGLNKVFGTDVYTSEDKRQMIDGVNKALEENFGTLDKILKTIIENPTDILFTIQGGLNASKLAIKNPNTLAKIDKVNEAISPINILKTEIGSVKEVGKFIGDKTGKLGAEILGKTTGTSGETIKTAFKQGGTKEFQSALKGETTPQDILGGVKQGLEEIRVDKNKLYGEGAKILQANKKEIPLNNIQKDLLDTIITDYKIKVLDDGTLDFSQSKITGNTSKANIQSIYDDLANWKDKTPDGLDTLKQRIQDYYRGVEDSGKSDRLSTILSNKIKDKIISEVPEYKEMVGNYEKVTNDLRDITKTLSLGKEAQTQTALTKLNSILRDNFTARQDVVKLIEQYTGKNIQAQIAGVSLNPMLAKGLAGVMTGGGFIFGQLTNPAFIAGLATASPRLIGEIAKTVGITSNKMSEFITNIKKYVNPNINVNMNILEGSSKAKDIKPIIEPLFTKPKAINNKAGFINPGKIVSDIKKVITPTKVSDDLISEAKKYKSADEFIKTQNNIIKRGQRGWSAPGIGDNNLNDVLKGKHNQPKDYFDIKSYDNIWDKETKQAIQKSKENGEITIYRAVQKNVNTWRDGDWIYFNENKAKAHGMNALDGDYHILSKTVKNKDVYWDGNDINEWGYDTGTETNKLKDIWNQAKKQGLKIPVEKNINNDIVALKELAKKLEREGEWDELGKIQKQIYEQANKPKVIKK